MPRTSETAFNARLSGVLETKHPGWRGHVHAERRGMLRNASKQPDLVVHPPGGAPVVLETEFVPAPGVEDDARARLREELTGGGDLIEQAIAVRIPQRLSQVSQSTLDRDIGSASFRYCTFSSHGDGPPVRWPAEGWLEGRIDDLAACLEIVSLSEQKVRQGADTLQAGIAAASDSLRRTAGEGTLEKMAARLHQKDHEQTSRMAMAIIANALVFHAALVKPHGIKTIDELRTPSGVVSKTRLLACWKYVLDHINYYPIFHIASKLLRPINNGTANAILNRLAVTANDLAALGATTLHDLSGRMFQRLIVDRKFLATFYTLPESAALLAELAVGRLDEARDWSDPHTLTSLKVADLACGTGTLLSASYRALAQRHRRVGGDDRELHATMMEKGLVAADIMPAATHLTASMLSSAHPGECFEDTLVHFLPYGQQTPDARHGVALGALDLIEEDHAWSLFKSGTRTARGTGEDIGTQGSHMVLPRETADLVIMNPPFTRPTGQEAEKIGVPVPSFAGFATPDDEQRAMSQRFKEIYARLRHHGAPAGHGNAGLASNFIDLAHAKVKPGGILALVLPAAFVNGAAWGATRRLLEREYEGLAVVTIATMGSTDRAFSADTGMAEALVVATKRRGPRARREDVLFVNLHHRPRSLAEGFEMAQAVRRVGPQQQGRVCVGTREIVGTYIRAPLNQGGCAALRETTLAETAIELTERGTLCLPRGYSVPLSTQVLEALGQAGLYHMDINGRTPDGTPRGPFDIISVQGARPQYPVLWGHDAGRERALVVEPDTEGVARPDCEDRAVAAWNRTASRLHFNRDFQLNSQALAACVTPESIGGRAWPNFLPEKGAWVWPLVLWANTTLGLLAFWWIGTRQQQGRTILPITQLPRLTVLDPQALEPGQLTRAKALFERFKGETFLPANEAYRDETRQALDRAVLVEFLELPEEILEPLSILRDQWCDEPSVHGGKKTRIKA